MNSVCKTVIVLSALIATACGLRCHQCRIGFKSCFFGSETTCSNSSHRCFKGEAQFNVSGSNLKLQTRGCLEPGLCGRTVTGSLLNTAYTGTFTCCDTDLCNSAPSLHLPVTMGTLLTLLSALWASQ